MSREAVSSMFSHRLYLDKDGELSFSSQAFANGYRFGEVFDRFGLQPDLKHFDDSLEPKAIVENYERLHVPMAKSAST